MYAQNNRQALVQSVVAASRTATVTGTGVDLAGFDAATVYVFQGAQTDGTFTPSLEDSDDNQTFGSATINGSFAAMTTATTGTVQEVAYAGQKRYVRVVVTASGTITTGGTFTAVVIKQAPKVLPA